MLLILKKIDITKKGIKYTKQSNNINRSVKLSKQIVTTIKLKI